MSYIYRSALTITRKQPYIDWANGVTDDGPALTPELAADNKTVYLIPEFDIAPSVSAALDACWEEMFEEVVRRRAHVPSGDTGSRGKRQER